MLIHGIYGARTITMIRGDLLDVRYVTQYAMV